MLKNYLKIAWRNLAKNKTFSLINIIGLAIGLSCFLLISLYVLDELSFDRYNANAENIYRINCDLKFNGSELHLPVASDMMGATLKKDYPQVKEFTRIFRGGGNKQVKNGDNFINENNVANVDSTFFDVFTLPAIQGDTKTALNQPNTVVITASTAKKYFGTTEALGRTIETEENGKTIYKITAIIKDMPENSHFHFDFLFSMKNADYNWGSYLSNNFYTYILLQKGTDYRAFEKNMPQYILRYVFPEAQQVMHIGDLGEFEKAGNKLSYSLVPLTKIHLYSTDRDFELSPNGNIQYVYIFSAVALFVLLIACINFMNLTTARSANRAKEVGIRKVLGTDRSKLMLQFLIEAIMMVLLSLAIAIAIVNLLLPAFNHIASKSINPGDLLAQPILILLITLPLIVGLLAGSYPAFFLSAFKPVEVLKGKLKVGSRSGLLRSLLVVFQFATSIILIIGTVVIYHQLHYIQNTNLGFNKSQVLIINDANVLNQNIDVFKKEILQLPGVSSGTVSSYLPVASSRTNNTYSKDPVLSTKSGLNLEVWTIDYDYTKTLGMQLAAGRNFSPDFGSDTMSVIINETTAQLLGYPNPIGKKIYTFNDVPGAPATALAIVGVVKDFHFESLRQHIGPLCFRLGKSTGLASFKVNPSNIPALLKQVENKWKILAPGKPFSYRFMDESFDEMYRSEQRVGTIALIFSTLAILIACLGLFGLSTFIAEQRTKEIGIRKVLGANVKGIVQLLSKDFIKLVLIAFVIAAPLSWYFMHSWLQDFAYRVEINWWIFAIAGIGALLIALMTVSFQAIKAALDNPVKSLRTE